jgi:phosphoenolpyruvate-protein kinase (PTS system EI component)
MVYVDGDKGEVWINPSAEERKSLVIHSMLDTVDDEIPDTVPGIEILANVNDVRGAELSIAKGAEGAGLVRTEYLFFESVSVPDEEKQFSFYSGIVKAFEGRKVTFRILDVGGDKPIPYFNMEFESNPYLGWRGTRFLLDNPDIVQMQVRAIARAREFGPIEIMYPMITDLDQLEAMQKLVRSAFKQGEWEQYDIKEGAMIEVPSLLFQIGKASELVDFFSIGTNDLIQYTFAVDRNNENVAVSYDPSHPVLWKIIEDVAESGRKYGTPVSVCGEMAGNPQYAERFINTGISALSMSPILIPRMKKSLMEIIERQPPRHKDTKKSMGKG